jgi:hypothetical protein
MVRVRSPFATALIAAVAAASAGSTATGSCLSQWGPPARRPRSVCSSPAVRTGSRQDRE